MVLIGWGSLLKVWSVYVSNQGLVLYLLVKGNSYNRMMDYLVLYYFFEVVGMWVTLPDVVVSIASNKSSSRSNKFSKRLVTDLIIIVPNDLFENLCWYSMFPSIVIKISIFLVSNSSSSFRSFAPDKPIWGTV